MRNYLATTIILAGLAGVPAHAQSVEGRVDRLESEMRAVQRKVFPGGAGKTFEPQITQPESTPDTVGTPSSSAVSDLSGRVDALETQLRSLTGQVETDQHRIQVLEDAFNAYKRATDARLAGGDAGGSSDRGGDVAPADTLEGSRPARSGGGASSAVTKPAPPSREATTPSRDPARLREVGAVEKPDTGNPAEDAYTYGFRLWQAKLYPEAEAQFKSVVATYPKHSKASFAQNMLGRSYLDEGKPSLASIAFYDNYKKMPEGERAPDSLYYLAQALMKLNKPADACKVYGELSDVYSSKISATMKADIARGRTEAKCT